MSRTGLVRAFGSLALAFSLAGCATRQSDCRYQIQPRPLSGPNRRRRRHVTSSWGVPLVPFKLYKVDDGTGEMTVVANNGRTPSKGSRVRVKGRVSDVGDVRRPVARPAPRQKDIDFQAAVTPPVLYCVIANDDGGHVVVRRRVAAPLGDGFEDRLDDRLRGQIARGRHDLDAAARP